MMVKANSLDFGMAKRENHGRKAGLSNDGWANMNFSRLIFSLIAFAIPGSAAVADTLDVHLTLSEILQRAESAWEMNDSLLAKAGYKVREEVIFNEVDGKGEIENSDTIVTMLTVDGHEEVSREIIYATKKEGGEKKEKKAEIGFGFSFSDTNYNFSLTEINDTSYIVAVSPKDKPREGDIRGTLEIDRRAFFTRRMDFEVPDPEGALKEFATEVVFEPMEGGLVITREMKMRGFAKAFLGIFKVRFTGHIRYSDYEILP
jgi:hypothetical protein